LWKNNQKVYFIIHTVVNLINVLELENFVNFMHTELSLWSVEWDWMRWPYWQQLSSLPESVKKDLIDKFELLNKDYSSTQVVNPYGVTIERLKEEPIDKWFTAKENIVNISKERNLDFLTMIPSFEKIWNIDE